MALPSALGPHCVGVRVVVRRVLPGRTGPTGGPALTDVLGVMQSWGEGETVLRTEGGELVRIALSEIVSGKPVPPRPSPRLRVSPEEAERIANGSWRPLQAVPLGEWLLRASGGFSSRANSVQALGDPGRPVADALQVTRRFYAERGLEAWAQVLAGSEQDRALVHAGWVPARPGQADTLFQIAGAGRAVRRARELLPPEPPEVALLDSVSGAWLATDAPAAQHRDAALAVLQAGSAVFAEVGRAPLVARGRVALCETTHGVWAGISDVWVAPEQRRRGLGAVVLHALLVRAASEGASTVFLQVRGDNRPALGLYDRLGFATHHAYRYLRAP